MITEQIEEFIYSLNIITKNDIEYWEYLYSLTWYGEIYEELVGIIEKNHHQGYRINRDKSFYLQIESGYVFLTNLYYVNHNLFSPALDKNILLVKINKYAQLEELSLPDCYNTIIDELIVEVEEQLLRKKTISSLSSFIEKVIDISVKNGG